MAEPTSGSEARPTLLERLSALLLRAPEDREQLLGVLREAHARDLLDADALSMIEGVLQVADLAARDIMVPRSQMDVIDVVQPPEAVPSARDRDRALALSGDRGRARQRDRHPARQGPAAAVRRRPARSARHAAPGGVHSRVQAPERVAARLPRQSQPRRDRRRRIRRRFRADHDRGRARADRRRHRGRVRLRRGKRPHRRRPNPDPKARATAFAASPKSNSSTACSARVLRTRISTRSPVWSPSSSGASRGAATT